MKLSFWEISDHFDVALHRLPFAMTDSESCKIRFQHSKFELFGVQHHTILATKCDKIHRSFEHLTNVSCVYQRIVDDFQVIFYVHQYLLCLVVVYIAT